MAYFSEDEIREVFRRVAAREPGHVHGDFLTSFAEAVVRADHENFPILRPAARRFIFKYGLLAEFAAPPDKSFPPNP